MKSKLAIMAAAGIGMFFCASGAFAISYNPLNWIKRPTASQQLAANADQEKKLSVGLQAILPAKTSLKDACTEFSSLNECVASLHASNNLQIKFNCLKWSMTGVRPNGDVKSCEAPLKPLSLDRAIRALKPDVNAKAEARNAERRAKEDIKDASS